MPDERVASPLMLELEPVVSDTYSRHIDTATPWYAHDYVPFDRGQNFKSLGGHDWDPSQVTLPDHVTDALEIVLITKDNLAGYHHRLAEHFILAGWWGKWIGRWTAEENLHAFALRQNLVLTRQIDPIANEMVRVEHVMNGRRADDHTQVEAMVFMTLWERAHAVFLRRLATQIEEPVLRAPCRGYRRRRGAPRDVLRRDCPGLPADCARRDYRGDRRPRARAAGGRRRYRRV